MANPYKQAEFKAFLAIIEDQGQYAHWSEIARALNVEKNTITVWKNLPEAQAAQARGISKALREMESAGKRDWRMWAEKLKLLGLNPATKVEHDFSDPIAEILKGYGLDDAGKAKKTKSGPPTNPA